MRFHDEEHCREAITSRLALMQGVAQQVQSGGQRKVKVRLLHEKGGVIARAVMLIISQLHTMTLIAEQSTIKERWALLPTTTTAPLVRQQMDHGGLRTPISSSAADPLHQIAPHHRTPNAAAIRTVSLCPFRFVG